jgi:nicotinate-nucleotide adenylyltransferase
MPRISSPNRQAARIVAVRTPPAGDGLRIGVMGGSFNPPHEGHAIVAQTALRRLELDRLWWLVTPGNPLKPQAGLAALDERMAKIKTLTAGHPRMQITAFERELQTTYTAKTLAFLACRYPRARFVWVMGADNLATFHHWQQWRGIAATMPIAVVDRPGYRLKALASPAGLALAPYRLAEREAARLAFEKPPAWVFLTARLSELSSTAIRAQTSKLLQGRHAQPYNSAERASP